MDLLLIVVVLAIAVVIVIAVSRASELFYVSIRDGRCLLVRGHIPPSLLSEMRAVVRMSGVRRGAVRAVKSGGAPRLVVSGLDDSVAQRLRNAFGARGFARATASGSSAAAASSGGRNLGQLLGLAWLAWLLVGRRE